MPATAARPVGAPGTGETGVDVAGADLGPSPAAFVACTVMVYGVPTVSPVRDVLVAVDVTVWVIPPPLYVIV